MPTKLTAEQIKFSTVDGAIPLDNSSITVSGVVYPLSTNKIVQTLTNYTPPTGSQQYTSPGTYSWVCPAGVFSVSAVAVGGGGGGYDAWTGYGGGGGGLGWKNNIPVNPGQSYTVVVGAGGLSSPDNGGASVTLAGNSYFVSLSTVAGYGGGNSSFGTYTNGPNQNGSGGGYVGDGGGAGGTTNNYTGGGGAGGYTGRGGNNQESWNSSVINGGYGGSYYSSTYGAGAGGGVGLNGATGYPSPGNAFYNPFTGYNNSTSYGNGGSGAHGGTNGMYGENPFSSVAQSSSNIQGGSYGGGGGAAGSGWPSAAGNGGGGAVRIIWGANRSYPNNAT